MSQNIAYTMPSDTAEWILCGQEEKPTYIKELIYEGDFESNNLNFSVDEKMIDHWADTHRSMVDNGLSVPLPIKHTDDPEANRGRVVNMYAGHNPSGKYALYGKVEFRDAEAAKIAKTSQVSIFSPPEFTDGKGVKYTRPITHVALTDYPVIPKLQGFESISASLVKQEAVMPLKELAAKLSLECENEDQLEETIVASFEATRGEVTSRDEIIASKDEEIAALKARIPTDPLTVTASHKTMLRDNRVMKLDRLVGEKISPAVKDELADIFCSEDHLTLSLSSEAGDGGLFDKVLAALDKNAVVQLGDASEIISLSKEDMVNPEKNVLLADVEKRRAALKR